MFVHYLVDLCSNIWDHGQVPNAEDLRGPIYCRAKQLWFN